MLECNLQDNKYRKKQVSYIQGPKQSKINLWEKTMIGNKLRCQVLKTLNQNEKN